MVFRRRDRRPVHVILTELFFPRGGWIRATRYVILRLRRLPDPPHRIARGIFIGVFMSCSPLFGLHFVGTATLAWVFRGNILAALLATFFANPVTLPFIALGSVELGHWLLGGKDTMGFAQISAAFTAAWGDIWANSKALFTTELTQWGGLIGFFHEIFLPYLLGGTILGVFSGGICYWLCLPILNAYHRLRDRTRRERAERAIDKRQKAAEKERKRAEAAAAKTGK